MEHIPYFDAHCDTIYRCPGAESQAHAPNEITWKQDLVTCAALYAAVPGLYKPENKDGSATSFRQELTGNDIK